LGVVAYNLGNLLRRLVLPLAIQSWSLTSIQQRLFKIGGRLIRHARYFILQFAEPHFLTSTSKSSQMSGRRRGGDPNGSYKRTVADYNTCRWYLQIYDLVRDRCQSQRWDVDSAKSRAEKTIWLPAR
jgi:hypothetical protein